MAAPRLTVMLVEDTDDIRSLLKFILEGRGHRVIEAMDGQQALDLVAYEIPDLILMDLQMPVMDGWEATRRLRQLPSTREVPIVGLSAHCRDGYRDAALAAGCNVCIQKPSNLKTLDTLLTQFLS